MIAMKRIRLPEKCLSPGLWKRPRTLRTDIRTARVWQSKCGFFRAECSQINYGIMEPGKHYPPRWHVLHGLQAGAVFLWLRLDGSPFRAPRPAFRAAEKAMKVEDRETAKARNGRKAGAEGK